MQRSFCLVALALALTVTVAAQAADLSSSLTKGSPTLKSAGPMCFGPEGILFVADPMAATIYAIDTGDKTASAGGAINIADIDGKLAARVGATAKDVQIADIAVNPTSGNCYLTVSRGQGPTAAAMIMKVDQSGKIDEVSMKDVKQSKVSFNNAPAADAKDRRGRPQILESITDMAYSDGKLMVAGLSNEQFASKFRIIPFPFKEADSGASVEIYHGAHGAVETRSPIRTFALYSINKEPHLLASYTCTPLVKFPVADLKAGEKITGKTVAELGNGNQPLDMIIYNKDGKDYVLTANTKHGVLKITTDKIDSVTPITAKVNGTAGLEFKPLPELKGVTQLDRLDKDHALLLVVNADSKTASLQTIPLP